jgi:ubiquinone/menaquinone biosynthesis C-methylase UbiE
LSNKRSWDNVWRRVENSYSQDRIVSQWDMFERMKIKYLLKIFPKVGKNGNQIRTLECGCGGATVSVYFSKKGYKTVAFDFAPEALRVARKNFEKENCSGSFLYADVENIPMSNNGFDIVMSFGLIEHFQDVYLQIKEMVRVLKPGGLLFLDISPNGYHLKNKTLQCENIAKLFNFVVSFVYHFFKFGFSIRRAYKRAKLVFVPEYFENRLSLEDYERMVIDAGLKDVRGHGNRPFPRIYLPGLLNNLYIALMRVSESFWSKFDGSGSKFSRNWGAGWWLYGTKKEA